MTLGVVFALCVVPLVGVLALLAVLVWHRPALSPAQPAPQPQLVAAARGFALKELRQYNIVALSEDVVVHEDGAYTWLAGIGRDNSGNLHRIACKWTVADFNGKPTWQLEGVMIGDNMAYLRED